MEYINKFFIKELQCYLLNGQYSIWNDLLKQIDFVPCDYSLNTIQYYKNYMDSLFDNVIDLSQFLKIGDRIVGLWTFQLRFKDSKWSLGSNSSEIIAPIFIKGLSVSHKKLLLNQCFEKLKVVSKKFDIDDLVFISNCNKNGLEIWHKILMTNNTAIIGYEHILYVDLAMNIEDIWSNFRKRYKTYINKGIKLWKTQIVDYIDNDMFNTYKEYHHKIAGRVTRPANTWNSQLNALRDNGAFMIFLYDNSKNSNELIGAAYFLKSKDECSYLSGAYDRSKYTLPVSHLAQYMAIEYCKKSNLQYYRIGERLYKSGWHQPTEKELTISDFKEGFASHTFVNLYLKYSYRGEAYV